MFKAKKSDLLGKYTIIHAASKFIQNKKDCNIKISQFNQKLDDFVQTLLNMMS